MGTWGPKLYQNDLAEEIRDYYKGQLYQGKKGEKITQDLLKQYQYVISDTDDAPVFWFALADTQWNFGRLEDMVKEQALKHIHLGNDLKRWESENPKYAKTRARITEELRQKLLSPQPSEKKISPYRLYHCEWNIGDVFAFRLESDLANEKGLLGRYFLVQKIDECIWHPGHVIPIVYVKITKDTNLPLNLEEYDQLEYVQTWYTKYEDRFLPIDMRRPQEDIAEKSKMNYELDEYGYLPQYRIKLLNISKKVIPSKLIYIGNFKGARHPQKEFVPHEKDCIIPVFWKKFNETFETEMIRKYYGHNLREYSIYQK